MYGLYSFSILYYLFKNIYYLLESKICKNKMQTHARVSLYHVQPVHGSFYVMHNHCIGLFIPYITNTWSFYVVYMQPIHWSLYVMHNQYISLFIPCTTSTLLFLYHVQPVHWLSYTLAPSFTLVDGRHKVKKRYKVRNIIFNRILRLFQPFI